MRRYISWFGWSSVPAAVVAGAVIGCDKSTGTTAAPPSPPPTPAAVAAPAPPAPGPLFPQQVLDLVVDLPNNWTVPHSDYPNLGSYTYKETSQHSSPMGTSVTIHRTSREENTATTAAEVVKQHDATLAKALTRDPSKERINFWDNPNAGTPMKVAGVDAVRIVYSPTDKHPRLIMESVYFVHDGYAYEIELNSIQSTYTQDRALFDQILQSMKFK